MLCDYMGYGFMFLSVATSNLVATSLAKQVSFLCLSLALIYVFKTLFLNNWIMLVFRKFCCSVNELLAVVQIAPRPKCYILLLPHNNLCWSMGILIVA